MCELFVDRVCAVCGKVFVPAPYHRFKRQKDGKPIYYCCWTCYLKDEKPKPKHKGNGKAKPVDAFDTRGNLIKSYPTLMAASAETRESMTAIRNCCRGITKATRGGYIFKYKEKEK